MKIEASSRVKVLSLEEVYSCELSFILTLCFVAGVKYWGASRFLAIGDSADPLLENGVFRKPLELLPIMKLLRFLSFLTLRCCYDSQVKLS